MKHLIFSLLGTIFMMGAIAQNGGQYPENNSVKLEWASTTQVKVTNKQSCESIIRVTYAATTIDITIPGNSYSLVIVPSGTALIKAKNTTNCGSSDFGLVELDISALPVKFASFDFTAIGNKEVLVEFETAETSNIKQYNVLISTDGINYRPIGIVWPDNVTPNRKYSIKVNTSIFKN